MSEPFVRPEPEKPGPGEAEDEHLSCPVEPPRPRPSPQPRSHDPLSGTSYRTVMPLDEGNMGLVVEAEHIALGTVVVVKLLHERLVCRPDFLDRMQIEAEALGALARLKHPNIVAVTDFAITPRGVPFLVMERLYGRSLAEERRRRGALPVAEAIDVAEQALAGLSAVHSLGMVHRDVKPGNLFLCDSVPPARRTVKLLDFGIVKVLSSPPSGRTPRPLRFPTEEGVTVGTPSCVSPEQARGLSVDARADLYAAGVLLYTLVVGEGPFKDVRASMDLLTAHATVIPPLASERAAQPIPAELDRVIARALAKRPEDRFATADELSLALRAIAPPERRERPIRAARFHTEPLPPRFDTERSPPPRFDTEPLPPPRLDTGPLPPSVASPRASTAAGLPWEQPLPEDTEAVYRAAALAAPRAQDAALLVIILALGAIGWAVLFLLLYWALRAR